MKRLLAVAVACAVTSAASAAVAAPLEGKFKISGLGDVRVGENYADFFPFSPDSTGRFIVTAGNELDGITPGGDFLFAVGTQGTIKDLNGVPTDTDITLDNFVEFDAAPQWNFTVKTLLSGAADSSECGLPIAAGDECTPILGDGTKSPFTLFNLTTSRSIVALSLEGWVDNGLGEISEFTGTFTSQLDSMSLEMALAKIAEDEFVQSSWSGEFTVIPVDTPPVPEPASLVMMGMALTGMGFAIRRRR